MPRGLVGGAVAQRPPGTSCFRFPEWSPARRSWGRWLCCELWNRGLRPAPRWCCLPAASRYSAGDSELWLLPLPVTREYEGRGGVGWRALTPRGCDGGRDCWVSLGPGSSPKIQLRSPRVERRRRKVGELQSRQGSEGERISKTRVWKAGKGRSLSLESVRGVTGYP